MPNKTTPLALALALSAAGLHGAPSPMPISYTLRFPAPQTHYVKVEARVPTDGRPAVELMMAVWTPGSYLVREYARTVEEVSATTETGKPLPIEKSSKNRWRIETGQAPEIVVRYRVYSREMSVRNNFVDSDFALINGAATFLTLADGNRRPHEVRVELPSAWKVTASPLPPLPGGGEHAYLAEDFDTLVDSPLYAGNARTYPFEAAGKSHLLVNEGEGGVWDGPRSAADAQKIVQTEVDLWGVAPYPRYVIFNLLTENGGGLEHKDACTLMSSRWRTRTREGYLEWLGLVAHEFFHAWNGKRLRPVELGPFDYEREVYTRSLWVAEGFTSYYGGLLVRRAGFSTTKEYLQG
ncbi:MAG: peptidase M61, partial [Thermoanaerobaculia bacterium]